MIKANWLYLIYKSTVNKYQNIYLVLVAVIIGVAAGIGNILFRELISLIQVAGYGTGEEIVLGHLNEAVYYKIILIPALGGLLVGIIYHFYKAPEGRGVPMVIKAIVMKKRIPATAGIVTTVTSAITLGSGGSAGREGPIVQIGAAIGSRIAKFFGFTRSHTRFAIASGAGGGLAATFNTPMAGAMFAAEVLLGRLDFKVFAPVVISCVSATVVSRAYFGNAVTFIAPEYNLTSFVEIPLCIVLGLCMGFVGALFVKSYYAVSDFFKNLKIPTFLKPAIGGLVVGVIGLFCRNIMGVGYGTIMEILSENLVGSALLLLIALKIIATSFTLGSGGAGGQFVPSLFVGAALGGVFGWAAHSIYPDYFSNPGSFALIGMGAMLAATMRCPITAILMIFEITQSYQVVLPLMAAVIIANVFSSWLEQDSFFTRPLRQEGVDLDKGSEILLLERITVRELMLTDIIKFRTDTPITKVLEEIRRHPHEYFPVVDENGIVKGMLTLKDLRSTLFDQATDNQVLTAGDFAGKPFYMVSQYNTLAEALAVFGMKDMGDLPVVTETDQGPLLVGLLRRNDILMAYNSKIRQENMIK